MITVVLSKVPQSLRGHLTKWLLEVAPGVFVGRLSARVRDELWDIVVAGLEGGTALMVLRSNNEQGFLIRNAGHRWAPVDLDGFVTLQRPPPDDPDTTGYRTPLSKAARYRQLRRK